MSDDAPATHGHRREGDTVERVHQRECDRTHDIVDKRLDAVEKHVTDLRLWRAKIGGSLAVIVFLAATLGAAIGPKVGKMLWPDAKAASAATTSTAPTAADVGH